MRFHANGPIILCQLSAFVSEIFCLELWRLTVQTNSGLHIRGPLVNSLLKFLMLASSLVLIGVGVPQLIAAISMAAGDPIWQDYREGKNVSEEAFLELEQSRLNAIKYSADNEAREQLAYLYVRDGFSEDGVRRAIDILEEAVAKDPLDSSDWALLTKLYLETPDRRPDAIAAWKASRKLAPNKANLLNDRAANAIYLFRFLDDEDRLLAKTDLEVAYRKNRTSFRRHMARTNLLEWAKLILNDPKKRLFLAPD